MREMKDSGIEWIGEIPDEWNLVQTKRFFTNTKKIVGTEVEKYDRLALTLNGVIKRSKDDSEGLQPEKFEGYQILRKNELVFKLIDLENIKTSRVGLSPYTGLVSPAYIVLSNNFEDNRFFYYWFMFMYYNEVFNHLGGEGVRSALNAKDVLSLPVPDIQFDEQRRIADYLGHKCSQIDAIIARQQEVIEKLKAYKLSVITEAVTKGLNPDVPMKDSGVEWIGKVPGDWTKVKLKNICQFINGDRSSNYPSPNEYVDDGIPFLGADSLCGRYVDITQSKKITKEKYQSMGGAKIQEGDILYTLRGSTIGKNAMATFDEGTVASSLMVIRPISLIPEYLLYWLNSEEEFQQRQSCINGSTAPNLSAENVGSFVMFLPSALEQRKIADYLDTKCAEIELTMLKKQVLVDQLGNYKKSLIYEVVTGKKEV